MIDHPSVRHGVPLGPMTTYKVGGAAAHFAEPADTAQLTEILGATPDGIPIHILGRGSNVVISDAGLEGLVLRLAGAFQKVDVGGTNVTAGGGASLPRVARVAAAAGRGGLGFFVGIPGSVGGAVKMNAGGHGSDTASVLRDAEVLDLVTRTVTARTPEQLDLTYRHSNLGDGELVLNATFATVRSTPDELDDEIRSITRWRKEHQPGGTLNAGSVFKNPPGDAAGAIIDRLGLKGFRMGHVEVSSVHGNFIIADAQATATDIYTFIMAVRELVVNRSGILLEPEVRFLGSFDREGVSRA